MTIDTTRLREQVKARASGWPFPSAQSLMAQIPALLDELERLRTEATRARKAALSEALHIINEARDNICPGGLAENRQHEESVVLPHLDGVWEEVHALYAALSDPTTNEGA